MRSTGRTPQFDGNIGGALSRAIAAHQSGEIDEAERLYKLVLAHNKRQFDALHLLGVIHGQRKNYVEASTFLRRALKINPRSADAYVNLGRIQFEMNEVTRAAASYASAIALNPKSVLAHSNYCAVLRTLGRAKEALTHSEKALAIQPDFPDAKINRANALQDLGRWEEALAEYDRVIKTQPGMEQAWLGRGGMLIKLNRSNEAVAAFEMALRIAPNLSDAWFGHANSLAELKRYEEAIASFDRALALKPDLPYAVGARLHAKMRICAWGDFESDCSRVVADVRAGVLTILPWQFLSVSSSVQDQLRCATAFVKEKSSAISRPLWTGEGYSHDRIRVAYLSADFYDHPVGRLVAELFEEHDRSRFEVIALSLGLGQDDEVRRRIKGAVEKFVDAESLGDQELAELVRRHEADIVIDLQGHTNGARTGVYARRPAPVQVNYLGFAGTTGAYYFDYIVADRTIIPASDMRAYTEQIAYLPDSFFPADSKRRMIGKLISREECGLPAKGFVYCSFNAGYKITPDMFDVWMRLLQQVDGSVLWLLEASEAGASNLRREAVKRGVVADRIVLARQETGDKYLARHHLADLFLDTAPYNGHSTASESLWMGLPVLTLLGTTYAGRVAASLLNAIGVPELVTRSLEEYERLALQLAMEPNLLESLKIKLAENRSTFPLFDGPCYVRHLEALYVKMSDQRRRGARLESISVDS